MRLNFVEHGAEHFAAALAQTEFAQLETALPRGPSARLIGLSGVADLLDADGRVGGIAARFLGPGTKPVRALLLDKNPSANWSLAWHQDRTIAVRARAEAPGFGPWTVKAGIHHAAPPPELSARMITLRVHLDPVDAANAPLLVAPASHRLGRIDEAAIAAAVARCGTVACLADRGDIWAYSTPILHASSRASRPARRRVLQLDYCASALPPPLEWLGVGAAA